jgi:rhamnosyltransferase
VGDYLVTVSILLAVYKGEAFLRPQLESLSTQTFSDFAVLWQDDGSEDRTPEILSEYGKRDRRFRAGTEQGKHLGAAANFLSLLRQSEGDYLLFCDQDDIWEKEKVETPQYVTVSVNEEFIESGSFADRILHEGDEVEFLYFMGGGK